ncbi:MAG: RagB/SusD family nutrient uptake outer membrane protein [Dysgonomonas sp.]|nr:RagB/SusD family nutrient uptake outer membrane protein [Dysgonomonas sp.]
MKKLIIICGAALAMLGATSCGDDFLSVDPSSKLPVDGYYNSESRIMESVVAAYQPLQWYDYYKGWAPLCLVYDSMSDDVYVGGGNTTDQSQIHLISQYLCDPINNIGGAWSASYTGINRCNLIIDYVEKAEVSETDRQKFIAEARVLRAWYYSVLWKLWGNVAYYDVNLTYPYIAEQKTAKEIYDLIEADLAEVLDSNLLPMKEDAKWSGRATQAMASMLYAEYVMYQKDESKYNKALGYMKAIITSGKYSLQPFENLWEAEHEWNDETIFDINYISKGGKRNWGYDTATDTDEATLTGGTVLPAMIGIDKLSGSPDYTSGGWGFEPVAKEAYDAYESGDKRRDIGILNMEKYIADNAAKGITVDYGGRYQNTGFFLRKYLGRIGGNTGAIGSADLNWDNNLRIYRYAETLLNAAELALRTGDGSAQSYLDQIRSRAGVASIPATLDNILLERRREFVGEGKRYFDLVRFDKAAEVLKPKGGKVLDKKGGNYVVDGIPERIQWSENKKYLPIPQSEIEAAQGTLTQNPY